jgi:P-type Ca2+ transporter type 2B
MAAAVASIVVNMIMEEDHRSTAWIEGFAILMAVFVSSFVQALNNYQKEKEFQKLNAEAENLKSIKIIRDGQEQECKLTECLVGDLVVICGGDEIAADGVIVQAFSIGCDESAMTGETELMEKAALETCIAKRNDFRRRHGNESHLHSPIHEVPSPILVSGTNFKQGSGLMIVTCTGEFSAIGKINKTIQDNNEDDETPLQKKLTKIADDIGKLGLICALLTVFIMIIRVFVSYFTRSGGGWTTNDTTLIVQAFLIGITVVVVAIPEGLPLAVTLSLAYSVKKMLDDKNLVRKLHACETMGGADIICSDKTGTLTLNKMFLTDFWNIQPMKLQESTHYNQFVDGSLEEIFVQVMTCNSLDDPSKESGNPTDQAILKYMLNNCGVNAVEVRSSYPKVFMEPFTSDRKRMSTILTTKNGNIMLLKGASELIARSCESVIDLRSGKMYTYDAQMRGIVNDAITSFARNALRTIGLAYKFVPANIDVESKDDKGVLQAESSGFTLVGVAGIKDIIRPEVPKAVAQCNRAGIEVKMITGDNAITARAIAKECNIISPDEPDVENNGRVMEGAEFYKLIGGVTKLETEKEGDVPVERITNGEAFDRIYKNLAVLARSRPEDKYAMVTGLKERGHVVAVTGDGTNDAPALSKASVGFAMGITGTPVAKKAAAIMLTDDNFNSIVSAVKWGRNIYDSIRKFLQFQLTVNVVAVVITLVSAAVTQEAILSSVQMLWVNMIMDTLASLALATEAPTEALLLRKPYRPDDYIISKKMAKHILGQAVFQLIVMMVFLFVGPQFLPDGITTDPDLYEVRGGVQMVRSGLISLISNPWPQPNGKLPSRHYTYNFNVFVMMQVFNFLNARKINDEINIFKGIFDSLFFPIIVVAIFVLQLVILTFGSYAFRLALWVALVLTIGC